MRWLITALIVFTLAGCGLSGQAQLQEAAREAVEAANLQMDRDLAECQRLYPDRYRKPVTPRMKCVGAARDKNLAVRDRLVGNATLDIFAKQKAQVLLAAQRFDKGEISEAEYKLEAENQRFHRKAVAAKVDAARQEAAASTSAAIQAATPPRTRRTNCNTYWGTVNCTTY